MNTAERVEQQAPMPAIASRLVQAVYFPVEHSRGRNSTHRASCAYCGRVADIGFDADREAVLFGGYRHVGPVERKGTLVSVEFIANRGQQTQAAA